MYWYLVLFHACWLAAFAFIPFRLLSFNLRKMKIQHDHFFVDSAGVVNEFSIQIGRPRFSRIFLIEIDIYIEKCSGFLGFNRNEIVLFRKSAPKSWFASDYFSTLHGCMLPWTGSNAP